MANPALLSLELQRSASAQVEWVLSREPVPYEASVEAMEARVAAIFEGRAPESVWLLEHPPLYTAGTSAAPEELLEPSRLPVFWTGRGVHAFVHALEDWLIVALARLGVEAKRREGQIGVFAGEAKIASTGIRLRHWVSFHGVSLNVDPNLEHFAGIIPCGLTSPVTSLAALGIDADMERVDAALRTSFEEIFGTISANACR